MLFDTPVYFVFLVLIVLVYWRLSWRPQNVLLLAASYFFYGWWDWRFLLLMMSSTAVDYLIARKIEDTSDQAKRRALLIASLFVNFTILGFFKYFNFFLDSAAIGLGALGFHNIPHSILAIILPPGISFYTFQEVAYIVDVYVGRIKASRNFVDYGLFISLFPHLIAGPIQRPSHLLPQVQKPRVFQPTAFGDGCMLILTGLVRKTVIADNCAHLANAAFAGHLGNDGWATLIGVYAFAWQIYGDFSGYSDLARGSAQLLGFHFMVNFRQPYLAAGAPLVTAKPLPGTTDAWMKEMMRAVVTSGTAAGVGFPAGVFGKTGTAEYGTGPHPPSHGWFIGYRGDLAFAVLVEGGGTGADSAGPIANAFLRHL